MKHKGLFGSPFFSSASSQISLDFCGEADRDVELSLSRLVWSTIYKHALFSSISLTNSVCHALSTKGDKQLEGIHIQGALDRWRTSRTSIHPVDRFIMKTLLLSFSHSRHGSCHSHRSECEYAHPMCHYHHDGQLT